MSASRRKGTSFETDTVRYLNAHGFPYAERRALYGANDCGDVTGIPGVMIECKSVREITLAEFMDQVDAEKDNAHADIGVAVIKRRMRPAQDAYVVMTLEQFVELLNEREGTRAPQSETTTGESRTA